MIKFFAVLSLLFLISCKDNSKSLQEIKCDFGDFQNQSIKLIPVDYTKTPIYNAVKHHPENYKYLDEIEIYSVGHMSENLFLTGFLVAPKKKGKYPVIIFNRGGNRDYGVLLVATAVNIMAKIAEKGYIVVGTNYRGNSRGEGNEHFGGDDVNDVKNLIQSLSEIEMADTSRIGLLGISRGGMMNYLTLKGESNNNIKAIINVGGITDLGTTIEYHPEIEEVARELIPNFISNRQTEIIKRSAIYWTKQLPKTTPILILHGTADQHVSYLQIPPFADSLDKNGIQYKLVSFQGDNHGLMNHQDLMSKMIIEWFDNYVKNSKPFQVKKTREIIN